MDTSINLNLSYLIIIIFSIFIAITIIKHLNHQLWCPSTQNTIFLVQRVSRLSFEVSYANNLDQISCRHSKGDREAHLRWKWSHNSSCKPKSAFEYHAKSSSTCLSVRLFCLYKNKHHFLFACAVRSELCAVNIGVM